MVKWLVIVGGLCAGMLINSCKKDNAQNVSNNCIHSHSNDVHFNFTILSSSGEFFPLNNIGGFIYKSGYGYKSILIYRANANQFLAFERGCTYDGCTNGKALIWVQTGNTAVKDSVCGSVYNINDGSIQNGPASVQLYQYQTSWDGNALQIFN